MPDTFKKGDAVKVRLTRRHELDGELIEHPAKFVRYHPGQTGWADVDRWADVELETAHSMHKGLKVGRLSVPLSQIIAAMLFLFLLVTPAKAQEPQTVSLQTVSQALAPVGTACTGNAQSFTVQNLGQISHQATALSVAASFVMEIDGGDNINATYRISNPPGQPGFAIFANAGSVSYIAQAFGYYAVVKVVVTCTLGSTFALSYSGGQTAFSPVIGPPGGTPVNLGGLFSEVQGIVAAGVSAAGINPLLVGGVAPAINAGLTTAGFDNFSLGSASIPASFVGTVTETTVPPLQQNGLEFAVAFDAHSGNGSTQGTSVVAPWSVAGFSNCNSTGTPAVCTATLNNATAGQAFQRNYANTGVQNAHTDLVGILAFTGAASAALRQGNLANAATVAFSANTLAGSTLAAELVCTVACSGTGLTDTQGNIWKPVATLQVTANPYATLQLWVSTTLSSAAADSLTFTAASGTIFASQIVELTGITASQITSPSTFSAMDPIGGNIVRIDAQAPNQITCNVTLSTATTTLLTGCGAPSTINNQPVRIYVTDIQVNTTTAGAGSVLQLVTGTGVNCATGTANLSAITYSGAAVALQTFFGMRTPLVAPLQSAVCGKQTGATPSTTTLEIHVFLAP